MTTRIDVREVYELLPRLLNQPLIGGPIVVEDRGQPCLVVLDGEEYIRYAAWRRRDAARAYILREMEQRQVEAWWNQGFDALDQLRQRAPDLGPIEIELLIDQAVQSAQQLSEQS